MFEFGRELKRLLGGDSVRPVRDGLTGGDAALLELRELSLLRSEGKAADVAAGRVGARDRAQRLLEAAIVWREIARRSGEAIALRKAAVTAETAAAAFGKDRRPDGWARARCEQGYCALLGAELFGDDGLNAAAEIAFREARAASRGGLAAPLADAALALIEGRRRLAAGDVHTARGCAARFSAPIAALQALVRRCPAARLLVAEARLARADLIAAWGARLKDRELIAMARDEADEVARATDLAYEPLTWARASLARAQAMTLLAEADGSAELVSESIAEVANVLDQLPRDHSPLDWARAQVALAQGLQTLAEESASDRAYEQAVTGYDRALVALKRCPSLTIRAQAASNRALCLARLAELTGDLAVLDAAETAFKIELSGRHGRRDPVGWALVQLNLARLYEARAEITRKDRGERAAAAVALNAALDVFSEEGLRSLSLMAVEGLERLRAGATPRLLS